jgi:SAM-dependent methyltransferase
VEDAEFTAMVSADDRHWWYRGRRSVVLAQIGRLGLPARARLLDAGCGSGRTLDDLARFGAAYGVDSSAGAVAATRGRGHRRVRLGSLEALPYPDATFDVVTCLDVLEHLPNDELALAELRRVTTPGGHLILTVPAYQALWSVHDEANHHYRRYRRGTLRPAVMGAGWEIVRDSYFNSTLLLPAALVRLARNLWRGSGERSELTYTPTWLDPVLALPFRFEAQLLGYGVGLPAGLSLLAVLRRPDVPVIERARPAVRVPASARSHLEPVAGAAH